MTAARETPNVSLAYDAVAREYDAQIAGDAWMREVLWRHFMGIFQPGHAVLDCGCGTGTDAIHLASTGVAVTAIDASAAMVALTRSRALGVSPGVVEALIMEIDDIGKFSRASFNGVISCFAALNTQTTLHAFAEDAARLLRPGGRLIIHLLNSWSLWEWVGLASRGRWERARRLGRVRERWFAVGGVPVLHHLERPQTLYPTYFERRFRLRRIYALGVFRPPRAWPQSESLMQKALGQCDVTFGRLRPFRYWGRFTVLDLEVRPVSQLDRRLRG